MRWLSSAASGTDPPMTDEEHPENTVPEPGDDDEAFDVYLPVTPAMDESGATHVAHMRGNQDRKSVV